MKTQLVISVKLSRHTRFGPLTTLLIPKNQTLVYFLLLIVAHGLAAIDISSSIPRSLHIVITILILLPDTDRLRQIEHHLPGTRLQRGPQPRPQKFRSPTHRQRRIKSSRLITDNRHLPVGHLTSSRYTNPILPRIVLNESQPLAETSTLHQLLKERNSILQSIASGFEETVQRKKEVLLLDFAPAKRVTGEVFTQPDLALALLTQSHHAGSHREAPETVEQTLAADQCLLQQIEHFEQRDVFQLHQPHWVGLATHLHQGFPLSRPPHPEIHHLHHRKLRFDPPLIMFKLLFKLKVGNKNLLFFNLHPVYFLLHVQQLTGSRTHQQPLLIAIEPHPREINRSHLP